MSFHTGIHFQEFGCTYFIDTLLPLSLQRNYNSHPNGKASFYAQNPPHHPQTIGRVAI